MDEGLYLLGFLLLVVCTTCLVVVLCAIFLAESERVEGSYSDDDYKPRETYDD